MGLMGPMLPSGLGRRGERAGIDLLEIADGMLFASADEEENGDHNQCQSDFHKITF